MRVGLTYDLRSEYRAMGFTEEETAEFDSDETVSSLEGAISGLGHEVERIGNIYGLAGMLAEGRRWDLVFNIAEGLFGRSREAHLPALLEAYGIPFTFSDPLTLALTLDKAMTKRIVRDAGIRTTAFWTLEDANDADLKEFDVALEEFPLFLKPNHEGTGKGVSPESVIRDIKSLKSVLRKMLARYGQPVLVEQYLPGREFTVGVLGTGAGARAVGVLEVNLLEGAEPMVYSFGNKELCEEKVEYLLVTDKKIVWEASAMALEAYRVLGLRDAGRVDFRADAEGRLHFLEINPIPGLHPTHSDLPILCSKVGVPYAGLIGGIMDCASVRVKTDGVCAGRSFSGKRGGHF